MNKLQLRTHSNLNEQMNKIRLLYQKLNSFKVGKWTGYAVHTLAVVMYATILGVMAWAPYLSVWLS